MFSTVLDSMCVFFFLSASGSPSTTLISLIGCQAWFEAWPGEWPSKECRIKSNALPPLYIPGPGKSLGGAKDAELLQSRREMTAQGKYQGNLDSPFSLTWSV